MTQLDAIKDSSDIGALILVFALIAIGLYCEYRAKSKARARVIADTTPGVRAEYEMQGRYTRLINAGYTRRAARANLRAVMHYDERFSKDAKREIIARAVERAERYANQMYKLGA